MPPSNLSLLGLVRHLAEVERSWLRHGIAGEDVDGLWVTDDDPDADLDDVGTADVEEAFVAWEDECELSRTIVATYPLDTTLTNRDGVVISLRWVLLHLIEEYARHNGHADLIRESIDGQTGE